MDRDARDRVQRTLTMARIHGLDPAESLERQRLVYTDERRKESQRRIITQLHTRLENDVTPWVLCVELQGLEVTAANVHKGMLLLLEQILEELQ